MQTCQTRGRLKGRITRGLNTTRQLMFLSARLGSHCHLARLSAARPPMLHTPYSVLFVAHGVMGLGSRWVCKSPVLRLQTPSPAERTCRHHVPCGPNAGLPYSQGRGQTLTPGGPAASETCSRRIRLRLHPRRTSTLRSTRPLRGT